MTGSANGATRTEQPGVVPLLEVRDLRTYFKTDDGIVRAVDGVSFSVDAGKTLGVVGESGSGKSVTMMSILGLNPRPGRLSPREASEASDQMVEFLRATKKYVSVSTGSASFRGENLLEASNSRLRALRGKEVSMIFQDPMTSLNPVLSVGDQLIEAVTLHRDVSARKARELAIAGLEEVGIPRAARRVDDYPHQFSGGMRQRVMIAMALINEPALLIADEPTTALDVTTQAQILNLISDLQAERGTAVVLITHDLGVVAETADDIVVMYAARVAEQAPVLELFEHPLHPYTWGLLGSLPRVDVTLDRLMQIRGQPPSLLRPPAGCRFRPRCSFAFDRCRAELPETTAAELRPGPPRRLPPRRAHQARGIGACDVRARPYPGGGMTDALLEIDQLTKHFPITEGIVFKKEVATVKAIDGVSLDVRRGETLGIVGESGCGKSTLARVITNLLAPTSGTVRFDGRDIATLSGQELLAFRRQVTMIFQDPYASLNPRKRVGFIVAEPLIVHDVGTETERKRRVQELLEVVGLDAEHYNRFPHEFSGGQRQRIGIARALAAGPRLIVCDEPVSALDVSVQAQILNLLSDLQAEFGLTYVFIAHDLSVVRHISDRVAVMYLGKLVELADSRELYASPRHPYTGALLSAVPIANPRLGRSRRKLVLSGDIPNPIDPPSACRFHPRCPRAQQRCAVDEPQLLTLTPSRRETACHFPLERWPLTPAEMGAPVGLQVSPDSDAPLTPFEFGLVP